MSSRSDTRGPDRPSATQKQTSKEDFDKALQHRVGLSVRLARSARRWSQRRLAKAIGRSQSFVWSVENGETDAGVVALHRIAAELKVPIEIFIAPLLMPDEKASQEVKDDFAAVQTILGKILDISGRKPDEAPERE